MRDQLVFAIFLKTTVFVLFIGHLFANTLAYCYWMIEVDADFFYLNKLSDAWNILHSKDFFSLHPPEDLFSFSNNKLGEYGFDVSKTGFQRIDF